ncbi:hypothetical protein D1872_291460 [compost metagenome]
MLDSGGNEQNITLLQLILHMLQSGALRSGENQDNLEGEMGFQRHAPACLHSLHVGSE